MDQEYGAWRPPFARGGFGRPQGRCAPAIIDETGAVYQIPPGQGGPAQLGGSFEGYGGQDDDLGADDDLGLDDDDFGGDDEKIARLETKIRNAKRRYANMTGLFQKSRKAALRKKIERAEDKLSDLKREASRKSADIARVVGGGGGGRVAASRQGVIDRAQVITEVQGSEIRRAQAGAGMVAQYVAPPGSGRLVRLPFYGTTAPTNVPRTQFTAGAPGLTASVTLTSEDVPYALAKVVGFVCQVSAALASGAPSMASNAFVEDLKTKGNANLFIHEQMADASMYDTDTEHLCGLRDYPLLRSPNTATVSAAGMIGVANDLVFLGCALLLDVIQDDVFGPGVPGPYSG